MATQTKEPATATELRNPYAPANIDEHRAEKQRIKEEQAKNRKRLLACLDPEYASREEARKPMYEWQISVNYSRPNTKGRMQSHKASHLVAAQDERTAWAIFCDKIGLPLSPHTCDRQIERRDRSTNA